MTNLSSSLLNAAKAINQAATDIAGAASTLKNGRLVLGKLFSEAEELVAKKSNMSFTEWCRGYIRQANGDLFSQTTIKNYIRFYRNPNCLEADRRQKREHLQKARNALRATSSAREPGSPSTEQQVNALVTLWDKTCYDARRQFLLIVNR